MGFNCNTKESFLLRMLHVLELVAEENCGIFFLCRSQDGRLWGEDEKCGLLKMKETAGGIHQREGREEELPRNGIYKTAQKGFPGGALVKNPPANAGDTGSSPGPGRFHKPRSS